MLFRFGALVDREEKSSRIKWLIDDSDVSMMWIYGCGSDDMLQKTQSVAENPKSSQRLSHEKDRKVWTSSQKSGEHDAEGIETATLR